MLQQILRDHHRAAGRTTFWDNRTWQALRQICRCRTEACGIHVERCLDCGEAVVTPNSCRDRNCPYCQGRDRSLWVAAREADVLPVPYFHVVCTLSHDLLDLVRWAPATVYGILHQAARTTLDVLLRNPRHLGARPGMIAVLHTWASDLTLHPHIHLIVPAGGWDPERQCWIPCRYNRKKRRPFLVPVNVLRACFTKTVLALLADAYSTGRFHEEGDARGYRPPPHLDHPIGLRQYLKASRAKRWVVYVKRPFARPQQLIRYLGRYTHRTAIDPRRIIAYDGTTVTYLVRNRRDGGMSPRRLDAAAFVKRFAQHVLPRGFHRIRHAGFLANRHRAQIIAAIRASLNAGRQQDVMSPAAGLMPNALHEPPPRCCAHCGGPLRLVLIQLACGRTITCTSPPASNRACPTGTGLDPGPDPLQEVSARSA